MRRAMRHAQILGARDPLMWRLVPALTREMGQAYPELLRAEALISETLKLEETRFRMTLARGLAILEEETRGLGTGGVLSGEIAFKLYDTYGFPLDLTQDALRARGIGVDEEAFDAAMERQRADARKRLGRIRRGGDRGGLVRGYGAGRRDGFSGLRNRERRGRDRRDRRDGAGVEILEPGEKGLLILNQTPFYGEIGRPGRRRWRNCRARVPRRASPTRAKNSAICSCMRSRLSRERARIGMAVELEVDHARRTAIRANHSATHILHEALRLVLGDHVAQKGLAGFARPIAFRHRPSQTDHRGRRSRRSKTSPTALCSRTPTVTTRLMSVDDARESGARALFGEKYGDEVRVVSMGTIEDAPTHERPIRSSSAAARM